jgi:hypothetical protein
MRHDKPTASWSKSAAADAPPISRPGGQNGSVSGVEGDRGRRYARCHSSGPDGCWLEFSSPVRSCRRARAECGGDSGRRPPDFGVEPSRSRRARPSAYGRHRWPAGVSPRDPKRDLYAKIRIANRGLYVNIRVCSANKTPNQRRWHPPAVPSGDVLHSSTTTPRTLPLSLIGFIVLRAPSRRNQPPPALALPPNSKKV